MFAARLQAARLNQVPAAFALGTVLTQLLISSSAVLVLLVSAVDAIVSASMLSILPFVMFVLLIGVWYPHAHWKLWRACMTYVALVIVAKAVFQLPLFCLNFNELTFRWSYAMWFTDIGGGLQCYQNVNVQQQAIKAATVVL